MPIEAIIPYGLVIGPDPKGAFWAMNESNKADAQHLIFSCGIVAKDDKELKNPPYYSEIDVFSLSQTFEPNSVHQIYADFLLNGIAVKGLPKNASYQQIVESPNCPPSVRDSFHSSHNGNSPESLVQNDHDMHVLLEEEALRKMWHVLSPGGELQIIDFNDLRYNPWIYSDETISQVIHAKEGELKVERHIPFEDEDLKRSQTLSQIPDRQSRVTKIKIKKCSL